MKNQIEIENEIEWFKSLHEELESGETETVKQSVRSAIKVLEKQQKQ